jgi:hypothetical protein
MKKMLLAFGILLFAAIPGFAQEKPGTLAALEFQTPKNGMVKQYEDGRKQKVDWHKQQKDTQALMVWETMSGDNTGTYIVGRLGQHWADLDKPSVSDAADLDQYNKVVGSYVQSLVTRYYEFLPKVSKPLESNDVDKFSEIITYRVRPGKEDDFRSAMDRTFEAIEKTKWPAHFLWYALVNGGQAGTYVLVIPHSTWASFGDNPDMKPFNQMLRDAFGDAEAESINKRYDASIESETSEIIKFRGDLSYMPGK